MDIQAFIQSKVPGYLLKRQEDVTKLKDYLDLENWSEIKMLGHQLKGNGPTFGFQEVGEIGIALEQAADEKDVEMAKKSILSLEAFLENHKA